MKKRILSDEVGTTWGRPILLARLRLATDNSSLLSLLASLVVRFAHLVLLAYGSGAWPVGWWVAVARRSCSASSRPAKLVPSRKEARGSY